MNILELEILVENDKKSEFFDIIKESNILFVKQEACTETTTWVKVVTASVEDAFWLGRNYQRLVDMNQP